MSRNIINTATSFKGKAFKRTTTTSHFKFAVITEMPDENDCAKFFDTLAEANTHRAFLTTYFNRPEVVTEVVTVDHSFKAIKTVA